MSRVKKTIKNAKINIFFYGIGLLTTFFSRKIFLDTLGDDFFGLMGTLRSIIGFLNIAELGVSTAIGYALYKPIFNNDFSEINKIISLLGYIYKRIGLFILIVGVLLSIFFPWIFPNTTLPFGVIYFAFFSILSSSLLGYFFNYHQALLYADQKSYIVSKYLQSANLIRILIQILSVIYFKNYYLWIFIEFLFPYIYTIIIRRKIKQEYPKLLINLKSKSEALKEYASIVLKVKQIFVQKIAYFVLTGTDNLLIYAFANLKTVTFVGNYQIVLYSLIGVVDSFLSGTESAIGNVVAEGDKKTIKKIFWEMMSLRYFIVSFLFINIYLLVDKFIFLWLGGEYILSKDLIILMLVMMTISQIRIPVMNYLNAYGLFSDLWASIIETIINIVVSLVLGYIYGVKGIFIGTIVSTGSIVLVWKPFFLYKNGFKENVSKYWVGNIGLVVPFFIVFYLSKYLFIDKIDKITNFYNWAFVSTLLALFTFFCLVVLFYLFNKGSKDLVHRGFNFIKKYFGYE